MATFYDKLLIAFIITVSLIGYGIIGVYGMGMDKKICKTLIKEGYVWSRSVEL
ncbi:MAG: hypothetical protein PWR27_162 [Petroclostridium sp.]|jgi:hypothetical protein|uniref:hypothetical protein n=1 Tax=Petroclostridium xylanilyticum TaxID=1792311 RepID=UPI0012FFCC6C|nr:hypothetical protein [Petroclostridium xylanilyticum]MDK2809453.1 hypothetical protein [Petroclostridium sp.]